jgi:CrcB protein
MLNYVAVAIGSALGGVLRYGCTLLAASWLGEALPWGTILINVLGSFVIGFFATLTRPAGRWLVAPALRLFVMAGLCGGYTTFSAFSLQTFVRLRQGDWLGALANVGLSVALCLLAVWLGHVGAAALSRPTKIPAADPALGGIGRED